MTRVIQDGTETNVRNPVELTVLLVVVLKDVVSASRGITGQHVASFVLQLVMENVLNTMGNASTVK